MQDLRQGKGFTRLHSPGRDFCAVKSKKLISLSHVLKEYEGEIICDLAEYYHIHDYRKVSPRIVLKLVEGLREDSRFVLKLTGRDYNINQLMQAYTVDRLSILCWQKTKDGSKGRNRPKMISELMLKKEETSDVIGFETASDFEAYRRAIIRNRK